jgi:hypothetical protein
VDVEQRYSLTAKGHQAGRRSTAVAIGVFRKMVAAAEGIGEDALSILRMAAFAGSYT